MVRVQLSQRAKDLRSVLITVVATFAALLAINAVFMYSEGLGIAVTISIAAGAVRAGFIVTE